jgi:hypothetical protein
VPQANHYGVFRDTNDKVTTVDAPRLLYERAWVETPLVRLFVVVKVGEYPNFITFVAAIGIVANSINAANLWRLYLSSADTLGGTARFQYLILWEVFPTHFFFQSLL